jgi:hypothetical protein
MRPETLAQLGDDAARSAIRATTGYMSLWPSLPEKGNPNASPAGRYPVT